MKLDDRFRSLEHTRVPDIWEDARQRMPRPMPHPSGARRVATIVLALLIGIAGVGAGIIALHRGSSPAVSYPSSPWSNGVIAVREVGPTMTTNIVTIDPRTGESSVFSPLPAPLVQTLARMDMAWSPDGTTLAVGGRAPLGSISASGNPGIWLLRRGQPPQHVESGSWESPSWSPDGSQIAFSGGPGAAATAIYTINANGSHLRERVSFLGLGTAYPQWSPDGTKFTFSGQAAGSSGWSVYVVNVDGSGLRKLAVGSWSRWSPDGRSLVFTTDTGQLRIVDEDGSHLRTVFDCRQIHGPCSHPLAPQFSPDGRSILFWFGGEKCDASNRCSFVMIRTPSGLRLVQHTPWIVGLDGSTPAPIKGFPTTHGIIGAAWQPLVRQGTNRSLAPVSAPPTSPLFATPEITKSNISYVAEGSFLTPPHAGFAPPISGSKAEELAIAGRPFSGTVVSALGGLYGHPVVSRHQKPTDVIPAWVVIVEGICRPYWGPRPASAGPCYYAPRHIVINANTGAVIEDFG